MAPWFTIERVRRRGPPGIVGRPRAGATTGLRSRLPDNVLAVEVKRIREMARRNEPTHGNPEAFHERKSEITQALTQLAEHLLTGKPLSGD